MKLAIMVVDDPFRKWKQIAKRLSVAAVITVTQKVTTKKQQRF
jgi:hypothetical protein